MVCMNPATLRSPPSAALRLARKAWRLLYSDSQQCITLAERAFAAALPRADIAAQGWARLTRGFHKIWYDTPQHAKLELDDAHRCFAEVGDAAGRLLAEVGLARCAWRLGEFLDALQRVLPLRDEGLRVLKHDERGMLLNTIAGCHSELGDSQQAFAYMYQALRESSAAKSHGFDVVLYCNLAHELIQLGDYHQALSYLHEGLERIARLNNARLFSVLSINRVICLTNLRRPAEALPDVQALLQLPADKDGRGVMNAHFETLALAALRAGDFALGEDLVQRAERSLDERSVPDERASLHVAQAELMLVQGRLDAAAALLRQTLPELVAGDAEGPSLRVRCMYFHALAEVHERLGQTGAGTGRAAPVADAAHPARVAGLGSTLPGGGLADRAAAPAAGAGRDRRTSAQHRTRARRTRSRQPAAQEQDRRGGIAAAGLASAGHARLSHRLVQPSPPRRRAAGDAGHGPARPAAAVGGDHRHGSFQDRQRRARPRRGRPHAGGIRPLARRTTAQERCRLPLRRRGVLPADAAHARASGAAQVPGAAETMGGALRRTGRVAAQAHTFSAGIADSAEVPGNVDILLKAADDALLRAKRGGRNRVLVYSDGHCIAA